MDGKQLLLYFNGAQARRWSAWRTPQGVYWISNTLTSDVSNTQMLGIAASLTPSAAGASNGRYARTAVPGRRPGPR